MGSDVFKENLPPIPQDIAAIAGPPYLGILLNWWLYGFLTLQFYIYHLHFPNDHRVLKVTVYIIFLLETIQTIFTAGDGFHWFVYGFGNMNNLNEFFLANFDTPILSSMVALVVQTVYAWRVYRLSRLKIVTGIICLFAIAQAAGGLGTGIVNQKVGVISKWEPQFSIFSALWVSTSAAGDITIATTMTWLLLRTKGWKDADDNVMTRVVRLTIETNLASSAVALVTLLLTVIPSLGPPKGSYFLAPSYILAKLYSNSFMAMLNNRAVMKQEFLNRMDQMETSRRSPLHFSPNNRLPTLIELHVETESFPRDMTESTSSASTYHMNTLNGLKHGSPQV